jgi:hypothetical protein
MHSLPYMPFILSLKNSNKKIAYGIAKELTIIDLNLLFNKETKNDTIKRLESLITHITLSFNGKDSELLIDCIQNKIDSLTFSLI